MEYLFSDPRPDLITDSGLWHRLLRFIGTLEDRTVAYQLQTLLWTFRSAGTTLRFDGSGLKFVPIISEGNYWDSIDEFEDMKKRYLGPYAKEISALLRQVMKRAE